jgi:cytochrome c5
MKRFTLITLAVALIFGLSSMMNAQNKYVGTSQCKMCHNTEKQGKQFDIWSKSKHATAFKALATPEADAIATKKGFKTKAAETPECLGCHVITADKKMFDAKFDVKDGVQCELCHGAGSAYKNMAVMKDHAKAVTAGLTDFKDAATIEAKCKTCHNEKSPTAKKFDFAAAWKAIAHKIPK